MIINIPEALGQAIGTKFFVQFGVSDNEWTWRGGQVLNIAKYSDTQIKKLEDALLKHEGQRGAKVGIRDIRTWRSAKTNAGGAKPRNLKGFISLLREYLLTIPGPRVYARNEDEMWLAYYVEEIDYHSADKYRTERVTVDLVYDTIQGRYEKVVQFYKSDLIGCISDILLARGYYVETDELREIYLAEHERLMEILPRIGRQCFATGTGIEDLDGSNADRYWWREVNKINFVRDGEPARVVVDVAFEGVEKKDAFKLNTTFWKSENEADEEDDEADEDRTPKWIEIPVHPFVPVFDLKKHLRLRTHVENLTPYVYDEEISEKLVLPNEMKSLVQMLVEHKDAGFKDIVRGKSGGAVVLLCGPPGTGKTLTAEVFAENEKRALYSVQCSQLGVTAEDLETELLKVFTRAKRWNAVLLLDEADVYVHKRGQDMIQNAIVGVFLRVLEYQTTVMFLTTNRPDDVDDAVASRCLARLTYDLPNKEEQWRIWKVLAANMGILVDESVKRDIVQQHKLSGRDVKNLLKLAILTSKGNPKITGERVHFSMQFHPTFEKG